ncbi:hypothetical protein HYE68_005374 [Fusarium pseudograminearum]|nr:hypothetical protein HYE68_005374 [Fusarium pseudograminearum]
MVYRGHQTTSQHRSLVLSTIHPTLSQLLTSLCKPLIIISRIRSFKEFHVAHPFLKREVLQSCLERVPDWSIQERSNLTVEQRHDIFQLYMAIAIGSIRLFREKTLDQHPFGFFSAALEMNPPAESRYNSLGNIENLILIARFGVYYNIGMYKVHFTRPAADAIDRMLTVGAESSLYEKLHRAGST